MKTRDITLALSALLVIASGAARMLLSNSDREGPMSAPHSMGSTLEDAGDPLLSEEENADEQSGDQDRESETHRSAESDGRDASSAGSGWILRGRILDDSGQPIMGARISCESMRSRSDGSILQESLPPPQATTGESGGFELPLGDSTAMNIILWLRSPDHASVFSDHVLESGGNEGALGDLALSAGGSLSGRVLEPSMQGARGAELTLTPAVSGRRARLIRRLGILAPAHASSDGSFCLKSLMPGSYRLTARASGMQEGRVPGFIQIEDGKDTKVENIQLQLGYMLVGIVKDPDGSAVGGADVRIRDQAGSSSLDQAIQTGEDGRFRLDHLPGGSLRVEIHAKGYLSWSRADVDTTLGQELIANLEPGLGIEGQLRDASSGKPILHYAADIHRLRPLDLARRGDPKLQLDRKIGELIAAPKAKTNVEYRILNVLLERAIADRQSGLERRSPRGPLLAPKDLGPIEEHSEGRFSFGGLDEGLYTIEIAPPDHQSIRLGPMEVRRGMIPPKLDVLVPAGIEIHGRVILRNGRDSVPGAIVTLFVADPFTSESPARKRSMTPWLFASKGPLGRELLQVRTDSSGAFHFDRLGIGRYFFTVDKPELQYFTSVAVDLSSDRRDILVTLDPAARLRGRVLGIPPTLASRVQVLALGGHGTVSVVSTDKGGSYRFDSLQPGGYRLRAFSGNSDRFIDMQIRQLLLDAKKRVGNEGLIRPDLLLRPGENRRFDVTLESRPIGTVQGRVSVRQGTVAGFWAVLRPVPGEAPGPSARSVSKRVDLHGEFVFPDTLVGIYRFQIYGPTSQRLHEEVITVQTGQTLSQRIDLITGGLAGRIVSRSGSGSEQLRGGVYVLPSATEEPDDLRKYRKTHTVHYLRVRGGLFRAEHLTPGAALAIVRIRGHQDSTHRVHVPTGSVREVQLSAGPKD